MGKQGTKFGFNKEEELKNFRAALNDRGMKLVEKRLKKIMKKNKGISPDEALEILAHEK